MRIVFDSLEQLIDVSYSAGKDSVIAQNDVDSFLALEPHEQIEMIGKLAVLAGLDVDVDIDIDDEDDEECLGGVCAVCFVGAE